MKIGVLKELKDRRVAIVPNTLKKNSTLAPYFLIEKDAGQQAGFYDENYASLCSVSPRNEILKDSDIILTIHPIQKEELSLLKKGCIYISLFQPYNQPDISNQLYLNEILGFSLDMIPRSTIAQSMDVLSSMASIAGYKAVLQAANNLDRYFPMMMTAAGTIRPTRLLVLGAGVAGLQAIATARKLGAMVEAFDVRKASKEEVESLGAKFIEVKGAVDDNNAGGYAIEQTDEYLKRQKQEVQRAAIKADVIITTAQIRGKQAPTLVTKETVEEMQSGSVIVDLAASTGGNCELTRNGEIYKHNGVVIIGNSNLATEMPRDASTLFSNNVMNFLKLLIKENGEFEIDYENEILKSSLITPVQKTI